jgi:membrane fusion protein, heavy metal efflux system
MSDAITLLVDDDAVLSQVLRRMLAKQGYTVVEASSVADALAMARQHRPQLALIDLCLPDGDGVELARQLEQEVGVLPVILMTAYPLRLREKPELVHGFAHVLTKPFDIDELRQVLEQALASTLSTEKPAASLPREEEIPARAAAKPVPRAEMPSPWPEGSPRTEENSKPGFHELVGVSPVKAPQSRRWGRLRKLVVGLAILVVGGLVTVLTINGRALLPAASNKPAGTQPPAKPRLVVELVEGSPHTIRVPESVRTGLAILASIVAQPPTQARPLTMPGSTALDPARVMRVKTRFNAQVVEIGEVVDTTKRTPSGQTIMRSLRPGDKVRKDDVLAVVWSIDVGGKKSDLVDALVQLQLDEKRLKAREELYRKGSLPEDTLNQTRRDVVSDRNAKGRAERTLRTWNVPEQEIKAVYEEADLVSARRGKRDPEKERLWARSELIAPRDGTIVECNVSVGEYVADNTINLFTIAEVDRLQVMANPPEDLLPELLSLKPEQMRWSLQMVGAPAMDGPIEEIGYIIDANQHTAVVKGYIDNPRGKLRAGQYVSAVVNLPPPPDVVEVPLTALAEDGKQSFVFVQPDPSQPVYVMRRVRVTHRFEKIAFVRSRLTDEEKALTPEEKAQGLQPPEPLKRGERFVPSGVLELRAALEDMESKAAKKR